MSKTYERKDKESKDSKNEKPEETETENDELSDEFILPDKKGRKKGLKPLSILNLKEMFGETFVELSLKKEEFYTILPNYKMPTGRLYLQLAKELREAKESQKKEEKEEKSKVAPSPKDYKTGLEFLAHFELWCNNHKERASNWYSTLLDLPLGRVLLQDLKSKEKEFSNKSFKDSKEQLIKMFSPNLNLSDILNLALNFKRYSNFSWSFTTYLSELLDAILLVKTYGCHLEEKSLIEFYGYGLPESIRLDFQKLNPSTLMEAGRTAMELGKSTGILDKTIRELDKELESTDPKRLLINDWVQRVDPSETKLKKFDVNFVRDKYKHKRPKEDKKEKKEGKETEKPKPKPKPSNPSSGKKPDSKKKKRDESEHKKKKQKGNNKDSDSDYPLYSSDEPVVVKKYFKEDKLRHSKIGNRISKLEKKQIQKRLIHKKTEIAMKTFMLSSNNLRDLKKTISVQIDSKMFKGHLDSLSTKSLVNFAFIKKIKKEKDLQKDNTSFKTADGRIVESKYIDLHLQTLNYYSNHRFYIIDFISEEPEVIIGLDLFRPLKVIIDAKSRDIISSHDVKMDFLYDEIKRNKPQIAIKHELSKKMIERLKELIEKNKLIKGYAKVDPIKIPCIKKTINKIYSLPYAIRFEVEEKIKEWYESGVIGDSKEVEHLLPLVCARKKNGKIRICLDLRSVNAQTPYDKSQNKIIPRIHRILSEGKKYKWFASIDLSDAYLSLQLDNDSKDFTTFEFNRKKYRFNSCPFGLSFIPAKFQLIMEKIFVEKDFIYPYIDDLLIGGDSPEDLEDKLGQVISLLNEYNFKINLEKSVFAATEIKVLGKIISHNKIEIDREKLIQFDFSNPKNGKSIMRILGFANFFRDHIPLISELMAPLEKLKNKRKLKTEDLEIAAKYTKLLKEALFNAIPLGSFDSGCETFLATDASRTGISGVLYQLVPCDTDSMRNLSPRDEMESTESEADSESSEVSNDEEHSENRVQVDSPHCPSEYEEKDGIQFKKVYLGFYSRVLRKHETRYPITKLELFGAIKSITHFHEFLYGHTFVLKTDHQPLEKLFSCENELMTTTMKAWMDILMDYSFEIEYVKGIHHVLPDILSRLYMNLEQENISLKTIRLRDDSKRKSLRESEWKLKEKLLVDNHDLSGHWGINRTMENIHNNGYTWKGMRNDIKNHINKCDLCRKHNFDRGFHPLESETFCYPMEQISLDVVGPIATSKNGFKRLLVVVDSATRYIFLRPLYTKKAEEVAKNLFSLFLSHGFPKHTRMDGGKEFLGEVNSLLKQFITSTKRGAAYNPQSNSEVESQVKSIFQSLRKITDDLGKKSRWDEVVQLVQWELNNKISAISRSTPFELFYGRSPVFMNDYFEKNPDEIKTKKFWEEMYERIYPGVLESIENKKRKNKEKYDEKRKSKMREFELGDLVMLETPQRSLNKKRGKLEEIYTGPFIIIKVKENGNYSLQDAKTGSKNKYKRIPTNRLKFSASPVEILDIQEADTSDQRKLLVDFGNEDYWITEDVLPSELSFLIDEYYEQKDRDRLSKITEGIDSSSGESDSEEENAKKTPRTVQSKSLDEDYLYYGYSSEDDTFNAEQDSDYIDE